MRAAWAPCAWPQEHAKHISQAVHLFRQNGVPPAIQILSVQIVARNAEKFFNHYGKSRSLSVPFPCLSFHPQLPEHPGQHFPGRGVQNHGGKAGRIPDVRRSHPGRITLFPPIQKGRLSFHQAACHRQHLFILQTGFFQHAGRPEQPVPVPRQAIRLPRGDAPHHPV